VTCRTLTPPKIAATPLFSGKSHKDCIVAGASLQQEEHIWQFT